MELIRLEGIEFSYPRRGSVLEGLDFTLQEGQRVGILGPNGAGKSTLFRVAMGLLKPSSGTVWGLGRQCRKEGDFAELRAAVGLVFQDADDQLFCPTVAEDVAFGPLNLGLGRHHALERVEETLAALGLDGYGPRVTHQLSGGEKRMVSLAAVLAMRPRALLLDEPLTGLDEDHARLFEDYLMQSSLGWALVSHDRAFMERTCQEILRLEDGRLV